MSKKITNFQQKVLHLLTNGRLIYRGSLTPGGIKAYGKQSYDRYMHAFADGRMCGEFLQYAELEHKHICALRTLVELGFVRETEMTEPLATHRSVKGYHMHRYDLVSEVALEPIKMKLKKLTAIQQRVVDMCSNGQYLDDRCGSRDLSGLERNALEALIELGFICCTETTTDAERKDNEYARCCDGTTRNYHRYDATGWDGTKPVVIRKFRLHDGGECTESRLPDGSFTTEYNHPVIV
jgi:hypothetical protein